MNSFIRYFVIKKSPVGTIVLDRDWLKPGDKIYFNNNEIEITSLPKEMSDNNWIYVINRYASFNVGDILYNSKSIVEEQSSPEGLLSPWDLTLEGFRKQIEDAFLRNRTEVNKLFEQFIVTGECKIPIIVSNPENEEQ